MHSLVACDPLETPQPHTLDPWGLETPQPHTLDLWGLETPQPHTLDLWGLETPQPHTLDLKILICRYVLVSSAAVTRPHDWFHIQVKIFGRCRLQQPNTNRQLLAPLSPPHTNRQLLAPLSPPHTNRQLLAPLCPKIEIQTTASK